MRLPGVVRRTPEPRKRMPSRFQKLKRPPAKFGRSTIESKPRARESPRISNRPKCRTRRRDSVSNPRRGHFTILLRAARHGQRTDGSLKFPRQGLDTLSRLRVLHFGRFESARLSCPRLRLDCRSSELCRRPLQLLESRRHSLSRLRRSSHYTWKPHSVASVE